MKPPYPDEETNHLEEGWVKLSFMVDPSGKASEIAVMESTGNKDFENAAVGSVEKTTFEPGTLNGKPTESAYEMQYVFVSPYAPNGARPDFVSKYSRLLASIQAQDRPAADAVLKELKIENLYEDAYYGFATYAYARVWGNEAQQLEGLKRALEWQRRKHTLPRATYFSALCARLQLELTTHEYAEAMTSWSQLLGLGADRCTADPLAPLMQRVEDLRAGAGEVAVSGEIRSGGWFLELFKRRFRVEVSQGRIDDVKLRCDGGYVYFALDPKLQYDVPSKYGQCSMQLEGAEGARFTLVQF